MLLTEKRLRALIHDILLEGVNDDALQIKSMLAGNDDALKTVESWFDTAGNLYPKWVKWVKWLADRYLRVKYKENDTLPDVLPLVVNFASVCDAINTKYNANGGKNQFKADVDAAFGPPERRGWNSPKDVEKMPSSHMTTLDALYSREKQTFEVNPDDESWKRDKIGQFGPWALYFPTSQQNSINIAGFDRKTLVGYTTWCTARTAGSNLFYNYVARGIMLFYAIDESKPPTDAKSRICLGYVRGELDVHGEYGGVTVDAQNEGLNLDALKNIFGAHLSRILAEAEAHVKQHGGTHPGKLEIDAAARDPEKFVKMLHGLSRDESDDLAKHIIDKHTSPEVLAVASRHKNIRIRALVASTRGAPPEVLTQLASDPDENVVFYVAGNPSAPPETLATIAKGDAYTAKLQIAKSWSWSREPPIEALKILARDKEADIRLAVASNEDVPTEVIDMMVEMLTMPRSREERLTGRHDGLGVDAYLASHQNISAEGLRKLHDYVSKIKNHDERKDHLMGRIASNKNVDAGTLDQIAVNSEDQEAWSHVAKNRNTAAGTLLYMAGNPAVGDRVKTEIENNKNATEAVRLILAKDKNDTVRYYVARSEHVTPNVIRALYSTARDMGELGQLDGLASNPKTPPDILEKLTEIPGIDMTQIIDHPNVSDEVLKTLASREGKYARAAADELFWRGERSWSRKTREESGGTRNENVLRQARYIVDRLRRSAGKI